MASLDPRIVGTDQQVPESSCTNCNKRMNGATCVGDDSAPSSGDVTVCIDCGHIMAFADDLTLRNLTDAEMVEVAGDENILAIQRARAALGNH